MNTYYSQNSSI